MKYTLISGVLPHGITMSQAGEDLRLAGITQLDTELFDPPLITNPSFLGAVGEFENIEITFDVNKGEHRIITGITLVDGNLPWGLEFTGDTIIGEVAELLDKNATYYTEDESPKWISKAGSLGDVGESQEVSIPLQYNAGTKAFVVNGSLPWGLEVISNSIVGTTAELRTDDDPYTNTNGPVWKTQAGMLGVFDEQEPVNLSVQAAPRVDGDNVNIYLVRGFMPYGLELTPSSGKMIGVISGTIDELRSVVSQYGPFNYPKINTEALPTMTIGKEVSFKMNTTVYGKRGYGFSCKNLPWGVELSNEGVFSGAPTEAGTYNVIITVQDDEYLSTSKTFKVSVS